MRYLTRILLLASPSTLATRNRDTVYRVANSILTVELEDYYSSSLSIRTEKGLRWGVRWNTYEVSKLEIITQRTSQ